MRLLALLFGTLAVVVWWAPLDVFVQSVTMALLAMMCLAFRSAIFVPSYRAVMREMETAGDALAADPGDPAGEE